MPENFETSEQVTSEMALEGLQVIAEFLKSKGFTVIDRFITLEVIKAPTAPMGFPIVSDGLQGIRASYSSRSGLKIWFTDGFE